MVLRLLWLSIFIFTSSTISFLDGKSRTLHSIVHGLPGGRSVVFNMIQLSLLFLNEFPLQEMPLAEIEYCLAHVTTAGFSPLRVSVRSRGQAEAVARGRIPHLARVENAQSGDGWLFLGFYCLGAVSLKA